MMRLCTFLCLILALIVAGIAGCQARSESAAAKLRSDIATSQPHRVVTADKRLIVVDERLAARETLLHLAVAALAVVSLCIAASVYFPLIAVFMRVIAAAAGGFAVVAMALRSVLVVPDWVVVVALLSAAAIALVRLVVHAHRLSSAMHNVVAAVNPEVAVLTDKSRRVVNAIKARLKGSA